MYSYVKKIFWLFWLLSIIGMVLAILEINSNYSIIVSILVNIGFTILQLFAYLSFVGFGLAIVTLVLLLSFMIIIVTISDPISKIGVYYPPKYLIGKFKQPITTNLIEVFTCNLILSLPLYFSIMYLINPLNYLNPVSDSILTSDVTNAFIVTIAVIPGYLLSIRLLAHPIKKDSGIPLLGWILKTIRTQYSFTNSFESLRERFVSFYFSLSASAFFIMVILYLYKLTPLKKNPIELSFYVFDSFNRAFIPIFDPNMEINLIRIVLCLGGFVFALFLTTTFGEIILQEYQLLESK
jgi:hypothetical protein